MRENLPPRELDLYKRCDEVLHWAWDPIGVAEVAGLLLAWRVHLWESTS